jgi:hypothetical protein
MYALYRVSVLSISRLFIVTILESSGAAYARIKGLHRGTESGGNCDCHTNTERRTGFRFDRYQSSAFGYLLIPNSRERGPQDAQHKAALDVCFG